MSSVSANSLVRSVNIVDGEIVNADVAALAAIAYSKLNLAGGIVNADVNAAAAIAYSKLNLATSIATGDLANLAVTEGKLAASAVAQGKLKSTTASGSTTATSYSLTGAQYSWWTFSSTFTGSSSDQSLRILGGGGDRGAGVIDCTEWGYGSAPPGGTTAYFDERYIQASPPYNNGPLFVHLAFDSLGEIVHSRVAPDPIYAYHGPTDITPQYYKNGKPYRMVKMLGGVPFKTAIKNPAVRMALINGDIAPTKIETEITLDYKDSDKNLMPHPFIGADLTGLTVVTLEPGTTLMQRFAEFCDAGEAREVRKIILENYLNIIKTPLPIPGIPAGVVAYRASLKLTP